MDQAKLNAEINKLDGIIRNKDAVFEKIASLYLEYIPVDGREDFLNRQVEAASKLANQGISIK